MDYGTLRGFFALLILALFVVIVIWSFSKKRKASFDEIAHSILDDEQKQDSKGHLKTDSKQETNNNV
ncbi:MAG: cbb3-type cytochrome c oxidase subunit 3 [Colwellia sp.]|nr:cbb3-type cytochrome c oxidase subunit 3 [Colwellia sp.]MCW8865385.1 cbb3-type cytochrome c oxidase subunit 3 [Colwellia sp.]MCW9079889.1 cbb3-type cytochrome c oxidase subunit 3 [Colwellia sp.]